MEIGGYLEFERYQGEEYHTGCFKLNTARNCLKYLIEARGIRKLWLSRWNCSAVLDTCKTSGTEIDFFDLDSDLRPIMPPEYDPDDYVYVVNYYGQVTDVFFPHMILDNVQAFFQKPQSGIDTIYTCRKYFGVADGAYLFTDSTLKREFDRDKSNDRIRFLVGRMESSGADYYAAYQENEKQLDFLPMMWMSKFTENILRSIDYNFVIRQRENNFRYLHEKLGKYNSLQIKCPIGPFAYPFFTGNGSELRKYLQEQRIYIAKLWPNVNASIEGELAEGILPIPCDQRYSVSDMEIIVSKILEQII